MSEKPAEDPRSFIRRLSPYQKDAIHQASSARLIEQRKKTPPEGVEVNYLGKPFKVLPGVFWPREDSMILAEKFVLRPGQTQCDVGTGSGVLAICGAEKGAQKVVALDLNPAAVESARSNAERYGFQNVIEARVSDVFSALKPEERFDVITANPPFSNLPVTDSVEITSRDPGFKFHQAFFSGVDSHLNEGGRVYVAQSNFGNVDDMLTLAEQHGFTFKLMGQHIMPDRQRVYYAFELNRRTEKETEEK